MNNLVTVVNGQATTSSLKVAEVFGKRHGDVIRAIEKLECPEDFNQRNFALTEREWTNNLGKIVKDKVYTITKDGFTLLAMGFTGKKAMEFKIAYIAAFNEKEAALKSNNALADSIATAVMERVNQNAVRIVQLENENRILKLFAPKCGLDHLGEDEKRQKIRRGSEVVNSGKGRSMSIVFRVMVQQPELPFREFGSDLNFPNCKLGV